MAILGLRCTAAAEPEMDREDLYVAPQRVRRWAEVAGTGFLGGVVVCFLLMTLSFTVGPEGDLGGPRSWRLPTGYAWTMIWHMSFPIGGGAGLTFALFGYWLLRRFLSFRSMVALALAGTLVPGGVAAFAGPAAAGLAAMGGAIVLFFFLRVVFEGDSD